MYCTKKEIYKILKYRSNCKLKNIMMKIIWNNFFKEFKKRNVNNYNNKIKKKS